MSVIVLTSGKEDKVLQELLASIDEVLEDLQVEVKHIQLKTIPYYQGYDTPQVKEVLQAIDGAVGVIIASRVELLSVSGSLATFFEYCSHYKGSPIFKKPVFALTASDWRGEREAGEYILHVWDILGGAEFGKLGVYTPAYEADKDRILGNVERMTEDFYRVIKQNRIPVRSSDYLSFSGEERQPVTPFEEKLNNEKEKYKLVTQKGQTKSNEERDIEDLASLFNKQLNFATDTSAPIPQPQLETTKHRLTSLPHYFQGQYDKELKAVVQYHLLGTQEFSGYITISDGDCIFTEGVYPGAEVELTAQEDVMEDILSKKITAQKAFMLGQLKVRGNFMLLAKIDQIFKAM